MTISSEVRSPLHPEDRFGPGPADGGAKFQLWAPGASRVDLTLCPGAPGQRRFALERTAEDFFQTVAPGAPGDRYLFSRDGGPLLPDPASRFQPDGVHGPSQLTALDFPWTDDAWRGVPAEELIVYELHVGAFSPKGNYRGVTERLDHLTRTGVTAIELMPLAAFPGRWNWGYDGVFHFAPHAGYGAPRDLMSLVDQCHGRGIAVLLDLVTNHFGPEGNAMWGLAPDFFRPDLPTAWSAGLNWDLDPVMRYFDEAARFWISTYHMDGIRFDAFHAIPARVRARHLERMARAVDRGLESQRTIHFLLESVDNQETLLGAARPGIHVSQLNFDFQRAAHALLTGERHGEYQDYARPALELGRCVEDGFAFRGRYSRHHQRARGEAAPVRQWDTLVNFIQNHDTCGNRYLGQRLDRLIPGEDEMLRAATALLVLHPAIPFLFMGQEWRASAPFFFFCDFPDSLARSVQQGRLNLFREMEPTADSGAAPVCHEDAAAARSSLCWDELRLPAHQRWLEFMRELLSARREAIPEMSRRSKDLTLERRGELFSIRVAARRPGQAPTCIEANLTRAPAPMAGHGELIYATAAPEGDLLPGPCTALFRG